MTTIAATSEAMAGDGQLACQGTIVGSDEVKVRRLKDGSLFGACGSVCDGELVAAWIEGGCKGDPPKVDGDFGALVLKPGGKGYQCGSSCRLIPIALPMAMGSGMDWALGAMDAGATAERAVFIATRRDPRSGGKITTLRLDGGFQ